MKRIILLSVLLFGYWASSSAQIFAVSADALSIAVCGVGGEVELSLSPRVSAALHAQYSPLETRSFSIGHLQLDLGVRYWTSHVWSGHYLLFAASGMRYSWGTLESRLRARVYGLKLAYGHAWMLSKRWNLSLQAGVMLSFVTSRRYIREEDPFLPDIIRRREALQLLPIGSQLNFTYIF